MTREEFESARGREGYRFELIEGRVYVSPLPNMPHELLCDWLARLLNDYGRARPEVLNFVSGKARVIVPHQEESTNPEPDLAAYRNLDRSRPFAEASWDDVSPILVAEVVSEDDPEKDYTRNVALYEMVPSIREYWILDPRRDPDRPTLRVYRRRGTRWQRFIDVAAGDVYTTRLLPGFALLLDPHAPGS
jgi:Uma2 family endonuclease